MFGRWELRHSNSTIMSASTSTFPEGTANANYGYTRVMQDAGCWLRGLIGHLQDFRTQEDGSDDESSSDDDY